MANTMVSFKKGLLANLPATKAAGTFYVTTDERAMYLDVDASTRIRLGDFQEFATVTALTANANPNTSALYYVTDINCLAKWNGSEYVQINKDTGMTSIEVTGDGNAITAAVYDAAGRKLTLTKGATYMTAADVDSKINAKVGDLKIGDTAYDTVKAYVDQKTSGIATDAALSELIGRVGTAEGEIDALQAAIAEGGSVTLAIADAKKAGTDAQAAADAAQADVDALEGKVGTIADGDTVAGLIAAAQTKADKGIADAATAQTKADSAYALAETKTTMAEVEAKDYATKTEAKGYADAKDSVIATAQAAADAAQADVDALEGKVGTVPEGKTVVQMIADAQTEATYDDTQIKADIKANADAIQAHKDAIDAKVTTLVGDDTGKSVRTIASEETAKIVAGADASYDTLKEIADWIISHKDSAAAMNSAIVALEGIVDGIGGEGEKATVVAYVTDAIAALNIGDYAKAADLTALAARVAALETTVGKAADGENAASGLVKAVADNAAAIAAINNADTGILKTAKDYADSLVADGSAIDGRIDALETAKHTHDNKSLLDTYTQTEVDLADAVAKKHEHTNKAELDKIADGDKAKWDAVVADHLVAADKTELEGKITAAQTAAEGKVTELANGAVKDNAEAIAALQTGKADKATTLAGYGITDAYTKSEVYAKTETYTKAEVESLLTWGEF